MPEKFRTSFSGYKKEDVNLFIRQVTKEYEAILQKLKKSDLEKETLRNKLNEYQDIEGTLRRSLVIAEESNKELKKMAKSESVLIVEEAKKNASRIVNDALIKAEQIEAEADIVKRKTLIYKQKVRALLEEQQEILDKIESER